MARDDAFIENRNVITDQNIERHQPIKKTRTRVSRACDHCKRKKDKCDGKTPCASCLAQGQSCEYEPQSKKRGLPEGYVRGLEKLWALVLKKANGLDDYLAQLLSHHDELTRLWNHSSFGEELHSFWKDSRAYEDLERLLKELDRHSQTAKSAKRKRDDEDEDEHDADGLLGQLPEFYNSSRYTGRISPGSITPRRFEEDAVLPAGSSPNLEGVSNLRDLYSPTALPKHAPQLLELYFSHIHCWLPILERSKVLKSYYFICNTGGTQESSNPDMAVLWAIFALTQQQENQQRSPQSSSAHGDIVREMYQRARCYVPAEEGLIYTGHVQALLLLALIKIGLGDWQAAWLLVGQAVRFALRLGLHKLQSGQRGKHAFLGCFVIDTAISARLEMPSHLRKQHVTAVGYLEEDGLEEWDPWSDRASRCSLLNATKLHEPAFTLSCFNRLVDVYCILNTLLNDDSPSIAQDGFCEKQLERLQKISTTFPLVIVPGATDSTPTEPKMPHHIYLRLAYLTTKCAIIEKTLESSSTKALAKTALEILQTLTFQDQVIGLSLLPPQFEHTFVLSAKCVASSQVSLREDEAISPISWYQDMADHALVASMTWPAYSMIQQDLVSQAGQITSTSIQPADPPSFWPQQRTSSTTINQSLILPQLEASSKAIIPTQNKLTDNLLRMQEIRGPNVNGEEAIATVNEIDPNLTASIAMPTSTIDMLTPSFLGDDVDAIFHDLAHLDTTDWTMGREEGLKEFGFIDDAMFRAFCNDPDRTVSSQTLASHDLTSDWPPPGFFPGHFENSSSHVGTGQN